MKKKNLKKLNLEKTKVSKLVQRNIRGGAQVKVADSILVHETEVTCRTQPYHAECR